jgi:hypothetical protein
LLKDEVKVKMKSFLIMVTMLSCLVAAGEAYTGTHDQPAKIKADVTFMDGSSQQVENPVFVYVWVYTNDEHYLNAPMHEKNSNDFHYPKVIHGVQLDQIVPCQDISRIEIIWPGSGTDRSGGADHFAPERILITLRNGNLVPLEERELGATSAFLLGLPVDKAEDNAVFRYLYLRGVATVEGQRGKFSARITCRGCGGLKPDETIKEISFAALR